MQMRGFTLALKPRADAIKVQTGVSMAPQKGLMSSNFKKIMTLEKNANICAETVGSSLSVD